MSVIKTFSQFMSKTKVNMEKIQTRCFSMNKEIQSNFPPSKWLW